MINFYSLKWGTKYGPEYVNRMYGGLERNVSVPFTYTIITDDADGFKPEVKTIPLEGWDCFAHQPKDYVWTREKMSYFYHIQEGRNVWLDLDILIHKDITDEVTGPCDKPTYIWNHWNPRERSYDWYGKGGSCHVNSSFVMWDGNNGMELFNFLKDNEDKAFFTYKSYDKFLFYQAHRKGMLDYWPKGFVSNYNREGFQLKGKVSIFNTSHIHRNKGIAEVAYELDEAEQWVQDLWTSYYST